MPAYIDGRVPASVSTLEASVGIQTPFIQQGVGAAALGVPNPAGADTFTVLSGVQTLSSKTLLQPVVTSASLTQPVVTSGVFTNPTVDTALIKSPDIRMTGGGTLTGGIAHNVVGGRRVPVDLAAGATKTLDLSTGDVFIANLTQTCTLTVANAYTNKIYYVIVRQTSTNYFEMSWMTGFITDKIASGPTLHSDALDVWHVLFDGTNHYGFGMRDLD